MKRLFNRYFFLLAAILNGGGMIISYESEISIDLEKSQLTINLIDLQYSELMMGSTKRAIEILKNNEIEHNRALDLTNIKTSLHQKGKKSQITVTADIQNKDLLLDKLGFFYQNDNLVYMPAINETITETNGTDKGDFTEFRTTEIIMKLNRKDDPELLEEWIQMSGKPETLNDILKW